MRREDLIEYARRDRSVLERLKSRHWAERKGLLGPAEGLRAAAALRRHILALRPDWPSEQERRADLATHIRVGEMLRRVAAPGPR